jgi:hypothetical protein
MNSELSPTSSNLRPSYSKQINQELIHKFIEEASNRQSPMWLFTLHPGIGRTRNWRTSSYENACIATDAFIQLANSYLLNKKSTSDHYLRSHVIIERSARHKWHSHLLVQQDAFDDVYHLRQLAKLKQVVNTPTYVIESRDGKRYPGSQGIGYASDHSSYFHAEPVFDLHDIGAYLAKWQSSTHFTLSSRRLM